MVTIMLLLGVAPIRLVEYLDGQGRSAYAKWFDSLNAPAAAKVAAAVYQLAAGNLSNVKGVGSGVFERKIEFGPGYRVYFGRDGDVLVILLGGSSKQRQQEAIAAAKARWTDYRRRKA
jgi:putative addiction module killer protein